MIHTLPSFCVGIVFNAVGYHGKIGVQSFYFVACNAIRTSMHVLMVPARSRRFISDPDERAQGLGPTFALHKGEVFFCAL